MSTVDSSLPRLPPAVTTLRTLGSRAATACISTVRAVAFWATIPLPLVILGTFVTGVVASTPLLVVGLFLVNLLCAALGHNHVPNR